MLEGELQRHLMKLFVTKCSITMIFVIVYEHFAQYN